MFDSSPKFLCNVHKNISQSGKFLCKMTKVFPKLDVENLLKVLKTLLKNFYANCTTMLKIICAK